ncbi:OmpA family protein [uncultured Pseudodesulfovibrio sp.]|uniref:OmpA/MotB family protein n=1 Tax=uncultured Pseudodesulfovibrio sp. TaxID=2035858 RepID=UPI0029C7F7D9|nr:OmpA family protein [uncultured Pseudodesulfovibrio sp.]
MRDMEKNFTRNFSSFEETDGSSHAHGMNDWVVPWADLMMVMFVLFVVLFIYASSHQDVKILFSQQSAEDASSASSLDPLIGLIGQIASRADTRGSQDIVRMAEDQVLYRSRADGVSVVREGSGRIRVTLRGEVFFGENQSDLKVGSERYLQEIAEVVKLSVGAVHVIGYASEDETTGTDGLTLSSQRAADVARHLIEEFEILPKRLSITGRGSFHPELPGTSQANQALNRRVEIIITNTI